jgi:uncharacterized protein YndB with AHSA1/START domain
MIPLRRFIWVANTFAASERIAFLATAWQNCLSDTAVASEDVRAKQSGGIPMVKIEKTVEIKAPVEKVFKYLVEPTDLPEIWPSMVEVKQVEKLPNGGTKFHWVYKMAGMRFEGDNETTEFVANKHVVTENKTGIPSTFDWTYKPENGGTKLTVHTEYTVPVPLLGKLAEPIILRINEHEMDTLLSNLKTRMELS